MATSAAFDPENDAAWKAVARAWRLREDTLYLNHGAFGPPPEQVRLAQEEIRRRLNEQPMDFFVRELEPALFAARDELSRFVGAQPADLVFAENATAGMNVVADSVSLSAGDEVLLTDHEYGAVRRIWSRRCRVVGAVMRTVELPLPFVSANGVVEAITGAMSDRTRVVVVSHITSPTATIVPVASIAAAVKARGAMTCVDGPHAVLQLPLAVDELGVDFYVASCHKWLSAPFGSGFLWVKPEHQSQIRPPLSWGRLLPREPETWSDEFVWSGTRDPSAYLTLPTATAFAHQIGAENLRGRMHATAAYARQNLVELTGLEPIMPDSAEWYGSMAHVPLPDGDPIALQSALWNERRIEIPIIRFNGRRYIRVSCPAYIGREDVDRLVAALRGLLARKL